MTIDLSEVDWGNVAEWAAAAGGLVAALFAALIYFQRPRGASLSIRYEKKFLRLHQEIPIHSEVFILKNLGPSGAQVSSVEAIGEPGLIGGPLGLENLRLLKDEEHRFLAFTQGPATPPTVEVKMTWIDSRGEQSRVQTVNLF